MINQALVQLIIVRVREFFREPEAIFWTYGFPVVMVIGLGLAFRNKPQETVELDVVEGVASQRVIEALTDDERFDVEVSQLDQALERLRKNQTPLVVDMDDAGGYTYRFDPTNPDARTIRSAVDDALQRAAGRVDPVTVTEQHETAVGSRYVDFLVPGLIGMNLMGGGLWGIGFGLVDMRVRKLLKRMLATPMRRRDFLLSLVGVRALFFIPEMAFLMLAAFLLFHVPIVGNAMSVTFVALIGALSFAGLGLLVACRAKRIETVTGLMNLVMLPMWLLSGIFFSSDRFPDALQPFIKALPLTQLIDALRAIMLDGESLLSQTIPLLILVAWGGVSFVLALRWFRWTD